MPDANSRAQLQHTYRVVTSAVHRSQRPPAASMPLPQLLMLGVEGTLCPRTACHLAVAGGAARAPHLLPQVVDVLRCYPLRILQRGDMALAVLGRQAASARAGPGRADAAEQRLWQVLYRALELGPRELFLRFARDALHPTPALSLLACTSARPEHLMRLPNPGMLTRLLERHRVRPHDALFVGSHPDEATAAYLAGVPFLGAWDFFGWPDPPRPLLHAHRCEACGRFLTLTCQCPGAERVEVCEICQERGG